MDSKKHVGLGGSSSSSSSSSLTMDLFGPKDLSSDSSSNVTSGLFGTVFPPASMVLARAKKAQRKHEYHGHMTPESRKGGGSNNGAANKDKNSVYQNQSVDQPCYFNSSIHYGGREVYSPQSWKPTPPHQQVYKKDGGEDDQNGNNSTAASRGNWWQGSLYY